MLLSNVDSFQKIEATHDSISHLPKVAMNHLEKLVFVPFSDSFSVTSTIKGYIQHKIS